MERKLFRQAGTVASGWVVVAVCALMVISVIRNWSGSSWGYLAWLAFVCTAAYLLLIRPYVLLDSQGVLVANVATDVHIPWSQVQDVDYRWGLRFFTPDGRRVNVWAIYAHHRPRSRRSMFDPGGVAERRSAERVSSGRVAMMVQRTVIAYEDGVEQGSIVPDPQARIRTIVRWPLLAGCGVLLLLAVVLSLM